MDTLSVAVINTLAWFELVGYPLTYAECWRYLWGGTVRATPGQVRTMLNDLTARGVAAAEDGMWSLAGSGTTLAHRSEQARIAIGKRRRAYRGARLLAHLPFVRFVGLGNTLALGLARPTSDIDLLIVFKSGRMFLGRLLVTLVLHLIGWRRHGTKISNRLCLSFYLDDEHLNLKELAYDDDPYLTYWVATLIPLVGSATYAALVGDNKWVHERLPNWPGGFGTLAAYEPRPGVIERLLGGAIGDWCEAVARRYQLARISRRRGSRLGDGTTAVVVAPGVLKFHESDRRPELTAAFRARLATLGNHVL